MKVKKNITFIHVVVWQKPKQHYEAVYLPIKKKILKKEKERKDMFFWKW